MLDYTAGLPRNERPATEAERQARAAYNENLVTDVGSGLGLALLRREEQQIHVMTDGIILRTCRYTKLFPRPEFTSEARSFDWSQVTSIDLRSRPVRIVADGAAWMVDGIGEDKRARFFNRLTEARLRGRIPAHTALAGYADGVAPRQKTRAAWMKALGWIGGIAVVIAVVASREPSLLSGAKCRLGPVEVTPDMFLTNGEADAGFTIATTVTNTGKQGSIKINARLETSEGNFTRAQDYIFPENGTRKLTFGFPEPTINATNIYGWVGCNPS